ncbi:putative Fe-S protein YdhL (DUF1289 family) [Paraburkholderia atlantica]
MSPRMRAAAALSALLTQSLGSVRAARATFVLLQLERPPVMSIASPCVDICKFDDKTGLCIGCMRTRDECKSWKKMKDKHRKKIIEDRPRRERKLKK